MDFAKMNKEFQNCVCGMEHKCPIDAVVIKEDAARELPVLCAAYNNILLVSDENTFAVCGQRVFSLLEDKIENNLVLTSNTNVLIPNEESIEKIKKAITDKTELVIGVGSGVINDLCKYVSFFNDLPYYIVATAPSMDGYASVGAAMILDGMKVTVNARVPKAIIADTRVLSEAPIEMLRAGYGDIVGKFSCLNDWRLSELVNKEYFCERVYNQTLACTKETKDLAEQILSRDKKAIAKLMEALVTVGILMSYVNCSRPASGSEHHFSHFFEITGILENKPYLAHGIDVLYSAYYTQKLREQLLNIEKPVSPKGITAQQYEKEIKKIYHSLADEVLALQEKVGFYKSDRFQIYSENWAQIKEILSAAPKSEEMLGYINKIGLNIEDFNELYGKEKIENAVWFAKDLKDRYTVLWLYFELLYDGK